MNQQDLLQSARQGDARAISLLISQALEPRGIRVRATRARDRLYLASALKDGVMVAGRGSLAEVLPQSMKALFARAGACASDGVTMHVTWRSGNLRLDAPEFAWRVCRQAPLVERSE